MWSPSVRLILVGLLLLPAAVVSSLAPPRTINVVRSPLFSSTLRKDQQDRIRGAFVPFLTKSRNQRCRTTTALSTWSSSAGSSLGVILPRGGASSVPQMAVAAFGKFTNFVGASKTRCLVLLLCSILLESYATALSKHAKDTGSLLVFARACSLYLMWYVYLIT